MRKYTLAIVVLLVITAFVLVAPHRAEAAPKAPPPANVIVINDPTEPVPTRDVTPRQPIQKEAVAPLGTLTGPANFVLYTVPAGKALVVEYFSSQVGIASGTSVNRYLLGIANDPQNPGMGVFAHSLAPIYHSLCGTCAGVTELFIASQPIRMYVGAGHALVVNITFSGDVGDYGFGFFAVTGYLVDVP
jgi:hypothetical protein